MSQDSHSDLSRLYRAGAQEEPPAWIDSRVVGAVRQQHPASVSKARRTFVSSWGFPVALAAVVVLSASVVMVMREEHIALEQVTPARPHAEPASRAPSAADAKPSGPGRSTGDVAQSGEAASGQGRQAGELGRASPRARAEADAPQQTETSRADVSPAPQGEFSAGRASNVPPQTPPAASAPPAVGVELKLAKERPDREPEASSPATVMREAPVTTERREAARTQASDRASAAAPAAKVAPAQRTPAPDARDAPTQAGEADLRPADSESPERWLQWIEQLRKAGRTAEARASLDEFRKRYPTYSVPESLK